jgi:hypothetical protein
MANICRCNFFGMKHKRQPDCEVFEQITLPALRKRDKEGIESQKHILKEFCKAGLVKKGIKRTLRCRQLTRNGKQS